MRSLLAVPFPVFVCGVLTLMLYCACWTAGDSVVELLYRSAEIAEKITYACTMTWLAQRWEDGVWVLLALTWLTAAVSIYLHGNALWAEVRRITGRPAASHS